MCVDASVNLWLLRGTHACTPVPDACHLMHRFERTLFCSAERAAMISATGGKTDVNNVVLQVGLLVVLEVSGCVIELHGHRCVQLYILLRARFICCICRGEASYCESSVLSRNAT